MSIKQGSVQRGHHQLLSHWKQPALGWHGRGGEGSGGGGGGGRGAARRRGAGGGASAGGRRAGGPEGVV